MTQGKRWREKKEKRLTGKKKKTALHLLYVTSTTETDIKTVVKCWYDVDLTVYRSLTGLSRTARLSG